MPLVRILLLCVAVLLPGAAAALDLPGQHKALLDAQLAKIEESRPGVTELYLLAAAMNNREDVFRHDVESLRDLFDRHWNTANRSVVLIADEATKGSAAYPTRANLGEAARGLGRKLDPRKDVLLLFLTSHGTGKGLSAELPGKSRFTYSAADVRKLLEASGATYRIVILSACYSGALMDELSDDTTLVVTAAHSSRASFGCSFTHVHTWFTEALIEALAATPRFEKAFQATATAIKLREEGGEAYEYSMPQIRVGGSIRRKLREIEARATKAAGWQPPVFATEPGMVRRMLGDYLLVTEVKGRGTEVRWLQLQKVGEPRDGGYPIASWAAVLYRNSGSFEALYDPKTRVLTGSSASLGQFRLSLDGRRLVGAAAPPRQGKAPVEFAFDRVLPREVADARAKHPPARMRAGPSSVIRLLYLSAEDCSDCRKWERDHLTGERLTGMPEFKQLDFVTSTRPIGKERLKKDELPANVAHLFDRLEADKGYTKVLTKVPSFVLLVDDQVRVWKAGRFLDSPIYPVLRAAVREKAGAQ